MGLRINPPLPGFIYCSHYVSNLLYQLQVAIIMYVCIIHDDSVFDFFTIIIPDLCSFVPLASFAAHFPICFVRGNR